jgi:large subunit ribosomal protein L23
MAILDRFKKKASVSTTSKKAPARKEAVKKSDDVETSEQMVESKRSSSSKAAKYAHLLLKPHVSEKAAMLADSAIYVFDVPLSANKIEVRKAVETMYHVHVISVRTQRGIGKIVTRGKISGRRSAWKKALVQLKNGETIALVEGV